MRMIMFTVLASSVLCVAAPAIASARHHHRSHHHTSHSAIRHESWGSDGSTAPTANQALGTVTPPTAGAVASFTNGVLTIKLTDGSTVSGAVTNATGIECQSVQAVTMQSDDHSPGGGDNGGSGSGDNNSSGSGDNNGSGDDNGGAGDENAQACATAGLTPGTVVQEAELAITSTGAIWDKVELVTP